MSAPQPPLARPWWRSGSTRSHQLGDGALAVAIGVADLAPRLDSLRGVIGLRAVEIALVLLPCGALLWRRTRPLPVLAFAATCLLVLLLISDTEQPTTIFLSLLAAGYAAGAYVRTRAGLAIAVAVLLGYVLGALLASRPGLAANDAIGVASVLVGTFVLGRSLGLGRAYTAQLERHATDLALSREAELRGVVSDERARIARELHDVVAHHVSVMTVQAAAARRQLRLDPDRSAEAMGAVESTGRTALAEMRRIVGVLRGPGEPAEGAVGAGGATGSADDEVRAPQPGLAELPTLIAKIGEAGLPVLLRIDGEPRPLSAGVDLAAYRIVQEALTNTLRHGGPTTAEVVIRFEPRELVVQVCDRGHGLAAGLADRNRQLARPVGHGLLGMRERVGVYGGQLYAGPRAGGGFEVLARVPIESVSG